METYLKIMLTQLKQNQLRVGLAEAPDPKHPSHKVRVVLSENIGWYRDMFAKYGNQLKRRHILEVLEHMIRTGKSRSKYANDLWEVAKEMQYEDFCMAG